MSNKGATLATLYQTSLALHTDLYQLTMAYGHWKMGNLKREGTFHLTFRKAPFGGNLTVACGLAHVVEFIERFSFSEDDLAYLGSLEGNDGRPLFSKDFITTLASTKLEVDIDAMPEGTVVFPGEPLLRVSGPLFQCHLLETPLLNLMGFQTLVATKAARLKLAAGDAPVLEFGLRRAQGIDGALSASRAAYIGGCAGTSNVLAAKLYGIPLRGTIAHSWVMSFEDELESFTAFASAMPNNCVLLVDTYDSLQGVQKAITVAQQLKASGHRLAGIRLDSGDLVQLSVEARRLLDEAGLSETAIVASNDLDEYLIENMRQQGSSVSVWAVGTRLVTAHEQPSLGVVYKLSSVRDLGEDWQPRIKLSEQAIKISTPGRHQVRRFIGESFLCDMLYDIDDGAVGIHDMIHPLDNTRVLSMPSEAEVEDLLQPVIRCGKICRDQPTLTDIRHRVAQQILSLDRGVKRFVNPQEYFVGLARNLFEKRTALIMQHRRGTAP